MSRAGGSCVLVVDRESVSVKVTSLLSRRSPRTGTAPPQGQVAHLLITAVPRPHRVQSKRLGSAVSDTYAHTSSSSARSSRSTDRRTASSAVISHSDPFTVKSTST